MSDEKKSWSFPLQCNLCASELIPVASSPSTLLMCKNCSFLTFPDSKTELSKEKHPDESKDKEYTAIVVRASESIELKQQDKVLDIYSRDGDLLGWYPQSIFTVGVEPDVTLAKECMSAKRVDLALPMFFTSAEDVRDALKSYQIEKFKVITLIDVLQDLPNPKAILFECKELLDERGVLVIQVPYLPTVLSEMQEDGQDKFVHCRNYFLIAVLKMHLQSIGLTVSGAELIKNKIRLYVTHKGFENFYNQDYSEKLRLYMGVSAGIVTTEISGRYFDPATYQRLDTLFTSAPIKRGNSGPYKPSAA